MLINTHKVKPNINLNMNLNIIKNFSLLAYAFAFLLTGLSLEAKFGHHKPHYNNKPPVVELNETLQAQREALKAAREDLNTSRKAAIEALSEDATREDKKAAIEAFKTANSDAISALKAQSKQLRDDVKQYIEDQGIEIPERPSKGFTKDEIREHIREHKQKHQEKREAFIGLKEEAIAALTASGLTEPTKDEIRAKIKEIVAQRKADSSESNDAAQSTARAD